MATVVAVVYGVVAGAMLLAGDKEDGTLDFLDSLTGRRSALFARKVIAGVLLGLLALPPRPRKRPEDHSIVIAPGREVE